MTNLLELLSDERIDDLWKIYGGAVPDGSRPYALSAIFGQVEPGKFVSSFCNLGNKSKQTIIRFVRGHYQQMFNTSNLAEFIQDYADDLNTLPEIVTLLDAAVSSNYGVNQINIKTLADSLREAEQEMRIIYENKIS